MGEIHLPPNLKKNILLGIAREELRRAKVYFAVVAAFVPISFTGVFLSGRYLMSSFYESGFYNYLSLLFSGDSLVFAYWKELAYALAETMPVVGIILFLIAISFLVWSGANTITNLRRFALTVN